tara:strand:+ start:269 stop:469 length:201 start_codon:yes stop_codon:yes gene_type:complete
MENKKMTNKEIQKRLVKDMQKDKDLKQYSKDIKELNQRQFNILLNVFKKVNKQMEVKNDTSPVKLA